MTCPTRHLLSGKPFATLTLNFGPQTKIKLQKKRTKHDQLQKHILHGNHPSDPCAVTDVRRYSMQGFGFKWTHLGQAHSKARVVLCGPCKAPYVQTESRLENVILTHRWAKCKSPRQPRRCCDSILPRLPTSKFCYRHYWFDAFISLVPTELAIYLIQVSYP